MKTNVSPRAPQGVRSKAPVRSTSARACNAPAKPLRPIDARAPSPATAPSDPLAALLAGLVALIEAHRASATSAPARAMLAALGWIVDVATSYQKAPTGFLLADFRTPGPKGNPFACGGLALRPVPPASVLAAAEEAQMPRLSPAHRALAEGLSTALLRLAEARQSIEGLAIDASNDTLSRASALDLAEEIRTSLALLEGTLCECSAELVDQKASAPGLAHALALSGLVRADVDAEGGSRWAGAQRFERKTARAAVDHFHRPA